MSEQLIKQDPTAARGSRDHWVKRISIGFNKALSAGADAAVCVCVCLCVGVGHAHVSRCMCVVELGTRVMNWILNSTRPVIGIAWAPDLSLLSVQHIRLVGWNFTESNRSAFERKTRFLLHPTFHTSDIKHVRFFPIPTNASTTAGFPTVQLWCWLFRVSADPHVKGSVFKTAPHFRYQSQVHASQTSDKQPYIRSSQDLHCGFSNLHEWLTKLKKTIYLLATSLL